LRKIYLTTEVSASLGGFTHKDVKHSVGRGSKICCSENSTSSIAQP